MSADAVDELGPVDYLVVELPAGASHFSDEMAKELSVLVETELIRILDILILAKDANGDVEALELDELDSVDDFRKLETELAVMLAEEDVVHLAEAMEPGEQGGRPDLGEDLGGAVRVGGAPGRGSAGCQWTHPGSGHRGGARSRPEFMTGGG